MTAKCIINSISRMIFFVAVVGRKHFPDTVTHPFFSRMIRVFSECQINHNILIYIINILIMMGSVEISKIDISCTIILPREIIRFITLTEMGHGGATIRGVPTMLSGRI